MFIRWRINAEADIINEHDVNGGDSVSARQERDRSLVNPISASTPTSSINSAKCENQKFWKHITCTSRVYFQGFYTRLNPLVTRTPHTGARQKFTNNVSTSHIQLSRHSPILGINPPRTPRSTLLWQFHLWVQFYYTQRDFALFSQDFSQDFKISLLFYPFFRYQTKQITHNGWLFLNQRRFTTLDCCKRTSWFQERKRMYNTNITF